MKLTPQQLDEVKAKNSCAVWAGKWVALRKHGKGFIGPCPLHSADAQARDSTSFECDDDKWLCAVCEDGGDVIKLVMKHEGVDFTRAIAVLGGAPAAPADPEAVKRAEADQARRRATREQETNLYRTRERNRARELAGYGKPIAGTPAETYLRRCRGLDFPPEVRLRCDLKARYYVPDDPKPRLLHTGPALLAGILLGQGKDEAFVGLHSTFLDVAQPKGPNKGKLALVDPKHPDAGTLNPKKMRGSKQGGRIELVTVPEPHTIVIGEGIEKVLGVWTACAIGRRELAGVAFWTSGDLGNLGGKAAGTLPHPFLKTPKGRAQRTGNAEPDLTSPAIEIPAGTKRVIVLGDSTSDGFATQMSIARARARWTASSPALEVVAAWPPAGEDFDDLFRAAGDDQGKRLDAALRILALVDAAAPPVAPASSDFSAPVSPAAPESQPSQKGGAREVVPCGKKGGRKPPPPPKGPKPETPDELNRRLAFLPRTDLGNAERFRERNRDRLLYCPTLPGAGRAGGWLWWDGTHWSSVGADEKVRLAEHLTVRGIQAEAEACLAELRRLAKAHPDAAKLAKKAAAKAARDALKSKGKKGPLRLVAVDGVLLDEPDGERPNPKKIAVKLGVFADLASGLKSWGRQSEANSKMVPIARHAAAYLAVEQSALDADRFAFNVKNGTLIFRRDFDAAADAVIAGHEHWHRHSDFVKFKPHDPRDRITKISPVEFVPGAECPGFLKFLGEVQPDEPMRRFLQVWRGYAMTGDTGEARVALFHGGGRNGKGVFETATGFVLGDYGGSTPIETFTIEARTRSAGQATPELAKLPGIRALRASEPKKGARLDEGLIKQVTGGDPLDARHLNRPFFTFLPQFKLTISTNHKPKIAGHDEAIWARVTLVPFEVFIPEAQRDPKLADKLEAEASGILNWMLDGLSRWFEQGLVLPEKVQQATADYRKSSDQLQRFLDTCTEIAPKGTEEKSSEWRVQSSRLLAVHNAWARAGGGAEWRQKGFSDAMEDRGFKTTKSSVMYFLGLKLKLDVGDFENGDGSVRVAPAETGGSDDEFT